MLLNSLLRVDPLNLSRAFVVDFLELVGSTLDVVELGALLLDLMLVKANELIRELRVLGLEHHLVEQGLLAGVSFLLHEVNERFFAQARQLLSDFVL